MYKIIAVKPLPKYKIWIEFNDGTKGTVDLSQYAGRGVFKIWDEHGKFKKVRTTRSGEIRWPNNIDMCPDSLYLILTKKNPKDIFPNLGEK